MEKQTPGLGLGFSPLARMDCVESAEAFLSQALLGSRIISVENQQDFDLAMNGIRLGSAELSIAGLSSGVAIDCETAQDCVILAIGEGSQATTSINGTMVDIARDISVIDHDARVSHTRGNGSREYVLKVPLAEVEQRLQSRLDRTLTSPLKFDNLVLAEQAPAKVLRQTLQHLIQLIDANPSIIEMPLLRSNFEELLYGLIISMPNNYSRELELCDRKQAAPASVRLAEEFMEAHADTAIRIADILPHASCSKKVLYDNFRRYRGYTPYEFLANVRLRMAHEQLSAALPHDTVTEIAHRCGFPHMGRFSSAYRTRYGVSPSVTLRRARAR